MTVPGYTIEHAVLENSTATLLENSTATLYRAREQGSGRLVCLEVFRRNFAPPADHSRHDLGPLLDAVRLLDHPNIWPVWRLGEADQGYYFVRPWWDWDGAFLSVHTHQGRLPAAAEAQAADWVRQLALAAQNAHEHGIYHCDIKPSNVLLRRVIPGGGTVPLLFGFETARVSFLPPAPQGPPEGAIVGTRTYMAPERITAGWAHAAPAVDVWALGVMLYQMLTGEPPFADRSAIDLLRNILQQEAAPPRTADPSIDADLDQIVMRCLRKKPEDRYASAADLADALGRWLKGERSPPPRSLAQRLPGWLGWR